MGPDAQPEAALSKASGVWRNIWDLKNDWCQGKKNGGTWSRFQGEPPAIHGNITPDSTKAVLGALCLFTWECTARTSEHATRGVPPPEFSRFFSSGMF